MLAVQPNGFEIEVALDSSEYRIGDIALVTEANDGITLGIKRLTQAGEKMRSHGKSTARGTTQTTPTVPRAR
jgi:hypothetical protein